MPSSPYCTATWPKAAVRAASTMAIWIAIKSMKYLFALRLLLLSSFKKDLIDRSRSPRLGLVTQRPGDLVVLDGTAPCGYWLPIATSLWEGGMATSWMSCIFHNVSGLWLGWWIRDAASEASQDGSTFTLECFESYDGLIFSIFVLDFLFSSFSFAYTHYLLHIMIRGNVFSVILLLAGQTAFSRQDHPRGKNRIVRNFTDWQFSSHIFAFDKFLFSCSRPNLCIWVLVRVLDFTTSLLLHSGPRSRSSSLVYQQHRGHSCHHLNSCIPI